jgi:ribonuclease D
MAAARMTQIAQVGMQPAYGVGQLSSPPVTVDILTTPEEVEQLVADVRAAGRCALDTEFVWERTYAPVLCLVQVATPDRVAVVDPIRGAPLEPIAQLVADPDVEVVMHAPAGDLAAFALHHGARPAAVYDTQLAAGFAGLGGSLSLERLVEATVHVALRHDEGFTDWSRRPLTPTQVEYAADDVRHLLAAADDIRRRLRESGREAWADEEIERRFGPDAAVVQDPATAWRRVSGRGRLRGQALGTLVEVAAWREQEARRQDVPASWLVRDPTLVEVARRRPRTEKDAAGVRGLRLRRGSLEGMLAAVERGSHGPVPASGGREVPAELRNRLRSVLPLASAVLQARAADAGIASELVATRDELEELIRHVSQGGALEGDGVPPLLDGWRRSLAGESLLDLLSGRVALAVAPGPPHVVELPRTQVER